jgi:hypothetical protein
VSSSYITVERSDQPFNSHACFLSFDKLQAQICIFCTVLKQMSWMIVMAILFFLTSHGHSLVGLKYGFIAVFNGFEL